MTIINIEFDSVSNLRNSDNLIDFVAQKERVTFRNMISDDCTVELFKLQCLFNSELADDKVKILITHEVLNGEFDNFSNEELITITDDFIQKSNTLGDAGYNERPILISVDRDYENKNRTHIHIISAYCRYSGKAARHTNNSRIQKINFLNDILSDDYGVSQTISPRSISAQARVSQTEKKQANFQKLRIQMLVLITSQLGIEIKIDIRTKIRNIMREIELKFDRQRRFWVLKLDTMHSHPIMRKLGCTTGREAICLLETFTFGKKHTRSKNSLTRAVDATQSKDIYLKIKEIAKDIERKQIELELLGKYNDTEFIELEKITDI